MLDIDESLICIYIYTHTYIVRTCCIQMYEYAHNDHIHIISVLHLMLYHAKHGCKMDLYPEIVGAQMSRWYRVCPATPRLRGAKGSEKSRLQMFILQRGPMKAGSVHTLQYDSWKHLESLPFFLQRHVKLRKSLAKRLAQGYFKQNDQIGGETLGVRGITKMAWIWLGSSNVDLVCVVHAQHRKLESIGRKMTTWKHELALCPAAWFWGSATIIAYKIRQNRSQNSYSVTVIRIHQPKFRPKSKANFSSTTISSVVIIFALPGKKIVAPPYLSLHSWHFMTWSAPEMVPSFPEAGKIYVLISLLCFFKQMGCKQCLNVISKFGMIWWINLDLNVSRFAVSIP